MAALYLHNAVFTPEPSDLVRSSPRPHSRNISTVSGSTLQAASSELSHPTEPLLRSTISDSLAYIDLFSRQPTSFDEPGPIDWGSHPELLGDPPTLWEKKNFWEKKVRQRLRRLKILMRLLELIFGGWAIYNTARYFIAFTIYDSKEGQILSLVLGACAGISFALLAIAVIINFLKLHLLMHSVPYRLLTLTITSSLCLSSLMLIIPAVVNVVMLFIWRTRSDQELSTEMRCRIDIDVVWSGSNQTCPEPYDWGAWMALSATRLGLTVILIAFYYTFLVSYQRMRKPSKWINPLRLCRHRRSDSIQPVIPPHMTQISSHTLATSTIQQHPSQSTMISISPSKKSANYLTRSAASTNVSSEFITSREPSVDPEPEVVDHETTGIVDRFRFLVSQITRETEQAVALARSDTLSDTSSNSQPSINDDAQREFYPPPIPPGIGYNEFGQPYPPEENVPMLNGYIRRMPTIESMGSREIASTNQNSSVCSGSVAERFPGSRPPTRISLSSPGSDPPSRTNSLSKRACDIIESLSTTANGINTVGNASEVGELIRATTERRHSPPSPSPLAQSLNSSSPQLSGSQGISSQSSRASSVPTAYYTATLGSLSSVPSSTGDA